MRRKESRRPIWLALIVTIMLVSDVAGADWPTFQHDNRRSGVTSERLAPPLSLRWIFRSPFPPAKGWARPVSGYGATKNASNVSFDDAFRVTSVGRMVYFASSAENRVYALDAAAGTVRWTFFTDAPPRLAPTVWHGKIYFGADDGVAYCLNANDGSVVWKIRCAPTDEQMLGTGRFVSLWPLRTGVTVDRGVAYFTAGLFPSEGIYFFAADAETGRVLWRRQLDRGGIGCPSPQGYLLAANDSIYMTSRVAPTRFSRTDGSPIPFQTPIPHHEYRFHNGGSYAQLWGENIVYGQAAILAYDPNKAVIDKYNRTLRGDLIFHWFNARRVLFDDRLAYVATDDHLLAVDQDRLGELAKTECKQFEEAYKQHRVADQLTALETLAEHGTDSPIGRKLQETTLKWNRERFEQWPGVAQQIFDRFAKKCAWMTPLDATEAMILAGNVIYAGGEDRVFAMDAKTGKQLWSEPTDSRVRGLAVANQRLFVSTIDGTVRCYAPGESAQSPKHALSPPGVSLWPKDRLTDFYQRTAERIVADSKAEKGYCLIVGAESGRLAYEIARRTRLNVYALEPDAESVGQARRVLADAGLYGGRVTVTRAARGNLPFPPYVFNLVVDQGAFLGGDRSADIEELFRVCKPCGGTIYVGQPPGAEPFGTKLDVRPLAADLAPLKAHGAKVTIDGTWATLRRGRVPQSQDWTHNYATAANTYSNEDPLVKGPFGVLWYGEPGPRKRIDRHSAGPVPLVVGSTMFLTGYDRVMAYDIYNGVPQWERTIVGATRTGLPLGSSNLVADSDGLFIVVNDRTCLRLDAQTGKTLQSYTVPEKPNAEYNYWGWIAKDGNLLYGSRAEIDVPRRRANQKTSEAVFAIDVQTGRLVWIVEGKRIDHDGIAIDDGTLFLLDRNLTDAERRRAIGETTQDDTIEDRPAVDRRGKPIPRDLRKLVALDAASGTVRWERPIDVTDITLDDMAVSDGRVGVAAMVKDGVVVVHGTASLGHPYQEFLRGEFARRSIYAFDAESGRPLWGGRRNYRKRPIIVGDYVYAEPHAWHLHTGEVKKYLHPISGREEPWDCFRGYIGCSHLLGSGAALFGNNSGIAHWNLDEHTGYTPWGNMSLACGLGAVPAGGIFVAPEGRAGCTCDTPIFTSVALYPRQKARAWSLGIPPGVSQPQLTPVRHVAVNLGAPGFRQDDRKRLWIPYPSRHGGGIVGDWLPKYQHDASMFYWHGEDTLPIGRTDTPWVFTSGYTHTKPLRFRLIDQGQKPAKYTVRLYFAEPEDLEPGQRVFDVSLQGEKVLAALDVAKATGGPRRALIRDFRDITVTDELSVTLTPTDNSSVKKPVLCGLEAVRQ